MGRRTLPSTNCQCDPSGYRVVPPPQAEAGQVSALPTEGKRRQETELLGGGEREHFVDGGGDAIVGLGLNERTRPLAIVHRDTHVAQVIVSGKEIYPYDRAAHELKVLECAAWLTKAGVNMSHMGQRPTRLVSQAHNKALFHGHSAGIEEGA